MSGRHRIEYNREKGEYLPNQTFIKINYFDFVLQKMANQKKEMINKFNIIFGMIFLLLINVKAPG